MAIIFRSAAASSSILLCIAVQILLLAPNSSATRNILNAGETLLSGNFLSIGDYQLAMKDNCNLELHHGNNLTWESHTSGIGTKCFLYLLVSGELAIVSEGTSSFVWMTGTGGGSLTSFVLVLKSDGNAVVYGKALWSTGTKRVIDGKSSSTKTDNKSINP